MQAGLNNEDAQDYIQEIKWDTDYHFGGYGKYSSELIEFINAFYDEHGIALDQVYNAKMMFGLEEKT